MDRPLDRRRERDHADREDRVVPVSVAERDPQHERAGDRGGQERRRPAAEEVAQAVAEREHARVAPGDRVGGSGEAVLLGHCAGMMTI